MSRPVLVVDDDPFIRRLILTTLEVVAPGELLEAADGQEALIVAEATHPGLVFLDIDMPRMDGIEACRTLRRAPGTADAMIVMLTAAGGEEAHERAERAGADVFLTKPFSPLDLLRLVDRMPPPMA